MASLRVTQLRSSNGANRSQIATLRSLGLRRIGHRADVPDTPQTRGMVYAVRHLISVEGPAGNATTDRAQASA